MKKSILLKGKKGKGTWQKIHELLNVLGNLMQFPFSVKQEEK
jgi:hypothetical protein